MKRFTKLFSLLFLMVATLIATASVTYAASTSGITFVQTDDIIDTYVNGQAMFDLDGVLQNAGGATIFVDLADFSGYDSNNTYSLNFIAYGSTYTYENAIYLEFEEYSQDEVNVMFFDKQYNIIDSLVAANRDNAIYWNVTVADSSPVLDGETAFITNVDNPISETTIRSYITAYDETDGNITHLIQLVSDNYSANKYVLGSYTINYSVQDSSGNVATLVVTVFVKDVADPVGIDDNASISYTQTFDIAQYVSENGLAFTDNYDDPNDLTFAVDFNDYTANKTIPGVYHVDIIATDSSGNEGVSTLTITVVDDVAPVWTGPTTLAKSNSEVLTLTQIKSQLAANDTIDGNLTASIQVVTDNYTGYANVVGTYTIQFSVTDLSGNTSFHTVTVTVSDDIPPIFYVADGYFISTSTAVTLSLQDVINILEVTGQLTVDGSGGMEIEPLVDEYAGHETEPGIYALSFNVTSLNGEESIYSVAIQVLEDTDSPLVIEEDPNWYDPFVDLWGSFKDFVSANILLSAGIALIAVSTIVIIIVVAGADKHHVNQYHKKGRR
ncbi:MAG: hypothetical protein AB7E61_06080 [Acholeplasmataceae bacterium]